MGLEASLVGRAVRAAKAMTEAVWALGAPLVVKAARKVGLVWTVALEGAVALVERAEGSVRALAGNPCTLQSHRSDTQAHHRRCTQANLPRGKLDRRSRAHLRRRTQRPRLQSTWLATRVEVGWTAKEAGGEAGGEEAG